MLPHVYARRLDTYIAPVRAQGPLGFCGHSGLWSLVSGLSVGFWFPECPIAFALAAHLNILSLMRRGDTKENFISFQFATFLSLE